MIKSWLDRIFGATQAGPARSPANDVSPDFADDLPRQIDLDVAGGFLGNRDIIESAVQVFADEGDEPWLRAEAERLTAEAIAMHAAEQQTWPARTDCDRLDAAFSALEAKGIVSRQNFSCCGTCGSAEIWGEIEETQKAGLPVHGYTFYHMQDTESAVEGYGICLNYGACEEGETAAVAIGHEVAAQLAAHGLSVDWDGRIERRISVPLDWKRRRTETAARRS